MVDVDDVVVMMIMWCHDAVNGDRFTPISHSVGMNDHTMMTLKHHTILLTPLKLLSCKKEPFTHA